MNIFQPGTLLTNIKETSALALQCGSLQPIATDYELVEQQGITFLVRILANLARKDKAKQKENQNNTSSAKEFNPFLPYEKDLFVSDISKNHLCLLNKYNVVDNHLLIVTRAFEEQETWLTLEDLAALWKCMAEYESLAFYNGGTIAGASQRHKHLQLIPLPLGCCKGKFPLEDGCREADPFQIAASKLETNSIGQIPQFTFLHALAKLNSSWLESPLDAAPQLLATYYQLLQAVGLLKGNRPKRERQMGAYNFLATREWMLIIPRCKENFQSISINSLGFAGSLFVHNQEQMELLKKSGPLNVLKTVAFPGNINYTSNL